jgi:hypothetical protein
LIERADMRRHIGRPRKWSVRKLLRRESWSREKACEEESTVRKMRHSSRIRWVRGSAF